MNAANEKLDDRRARVSVLGSVSFGWLYQQGGFLFDEAFFLDPLVHRERERRIHAFVARSFPREPIYNVEAHLVEVEGRRSPVVLVGALQPNLILGAAMGARFVFYGDKDPDITPTPLADLTRLEDLWKTDWPNTWPTRLFLEQIHALRESADPHLTVIPPFFWDTTGRATTHGILTTAQKLMGDRIFLEMADNPGFVREFFGWIVDAYCQLIRLFAEAAALEVTGLHTGDCSVCMIGPEPFSEFILPQLNELTRRVGPLRLHSCGRSDHLLDLFSKVENLASLNVGSRTSVAAIRQRFGPIRIDLIPDVGLLTTGTPRDVDAWVRETVAENGEGELQFQYHLDVSQPEENCLQIHRTLEELGLRTPRVEIY